MSDLAESYPPVPESVPRARRALLRLAAAAGAATRQLDAIGLAVSEAMTQAVARSRGCQEPIRVTAAIDPHGLAVSVADEAVAATPRELVQAARRRASSLGLALIAESADAVVISRRPTGGTELTMRFGFSPRT